VPSSNSLLNTITIMFFKSLKWLEVHKTCRLLVVVRVVSVYWSISQLAKRNVIVDLLDFYTRLLDF
jgi:hypothetical protein